MTREGDLVASSSLFLPTDNMPYVLSFPMGLILSSNRTTEEWLLSYGEGDERVKVLAMDRYELESLFTGPFDIRLFGPLPTIEPMGGDHYHDNRATKLTHYGYFNQLNCGDDAFVTVFKWLHEHYYPELQIHFTTRVLPVTTTTAQEEDEILVLGGGDVISPYFIDPIRARLLVEHQMSRKRLFAVGVGIPYMEHAKDLDLFEHSIVRNSADVAQINDQSRVSYMPDIVMLLPHIWGRRNRPSTNSSRPRIGLCLTQTFYHPDHVPLYDHFINQMAQVCIRLEDAGWEVNLIPFGQHPLKQKENDLIMLRRLTELVAGTRLLHSSDDDLDNYVKRTYDRVGEMDFLVCTRFHSHIFALCHRIPFVSLSCTRKCIELMANLNLDEDLLYRLPTNEIGIPDTTVDGDSISDWLLTKTESQNQIRETVSQVSRKLDRQISRLGPKLRSMFLCPQAIVHECSTTEWYADTGDSIISQLVD